MGWAARNKVGPPAQTLAADLQEAPNGRWLPTGTPVQVENARHVRFVDRSYSVDQYGTYRRVPERIPTAILRVVEAKNA